MKKYKVTLKYEFECEVEADGEYEAMDKAEDVCSNERYLNEISVSDYDSVEVKEI